MHTKRTKGHSMHDDPMLRDLETALEYGAGTDQVWHIPENASIKLADGPGHLLAGAVISWWR
jgi:hypothetical protein